MNNPRGKEIGSKSKGVSISFTEKEWEEIDRRIVELKLATGGNAKKGRSKYFQMLREYDRVMQLQKYYHESDGTVHFFPPEAARALLYPTGGEALEELIAERLKQARFEVNEAGELAADIVQTITQAEAKPKKTKEG